MSSMCFFLVKNKIKFARINMNYLQTIACAKAENLLATLHGSTAASFYS